MKSVDSEAVPSDNELSSLSVVVSNIEPGTTQLELASHFQLVGDIKKVFMSEDTREEAAHACITFKDAATATCSYNWKVPTAVLPSPAEMKLIDSTKSYIQSENINLEHHVGVIGFG